MTDLKRATNLLKEILKLRKLYEIDVEEGTGIGNESYFDYIFGSSIFKYYKKKDIIVHQNFEPFANVNFIKMENFFKDRKDLKGKFITLIINPNFNNYDFAYYVPETAIRIGLHLVDKLLSVQYIPYSKEYVDFLCKKEKGGYYICYNGGMKPNRILLINELARLGIQEKGLISLLGVKNKLENNFLTKKYMDGFWKADFLENKYPYEFETEFFNTHDFIPDKSSAVFLQQSNHELIKYISPSGSDSSRGESQQANLYYNKKDTESYYFNIVSESYPRAMNDEESAVVSEKTFKALLTSPIILNAEKGALQHLKNLGFKTFPEWFDESYDDMLAGPNKTMFIAKQIEKICSMKISKVHELYVETLPKVLYNQKRIVEIVEEWRKKVDFETWYPLEYGEETLTITSTHSDDAIEDGKLNFLYNNENINEYVYE
tara:strand:- start:2449 stop:3744 length:1296 start_codon:yes stop_codon:yes gene_type:complete